MEELYTGWRRRVGKFGSLPEEVQYSGPIIQKTVKTRSPVARRSGAVLDAPVEPGRAKRSPNVSGPSTGAKRRRMSTSETGAAGSTNPSPHGAVSGRYREGTEDPVDEVDGLAMGDDDSDEDWRA
jgi:hypothetical protein